MLGEWFDALCNGMYRTLAFLMQLSEGYSPATKGGLQNGHMRGFLRVLNYFLPFGSVSVQFSTVAQLCLTLCDPVNCSTPGFPVHHKLPEFAQTPIHSVGDAIQPSHPLSCPLPPAFDLSQHQGLFQWVGSSYQVAKLLERQLQHQSFQWIFRTDFL